MINFNDHLNKLSDHQSSLGLGNISKNENLIEFPNSNKQLSNQEIGKWVDALMQMPEERKSFGSLDNFSTLFDSEPFEKLAEKLLDNGIA